VRRGRRLAVVLLLLGAGLLLWPEAAPGPTGAWLREQGLEPRYANVAGCRVRYVRTGSGSPVLLLHGFASSIYTWNEILPSLARHHDVVALDLPGSGLSDQPADLTWRTLPAAVLGLMDRLAIPHAALVGNSLGGAVALTLALDHRERVDRLLLVDAAGYNLAAGKRPLALRLAGSRLGRVADFLPIRRFLVRASLRQVFHDPRFVTPDRVEEYLAPLARPGALAAARSLLASGDAGAEAFARRIGAVAVPTWIVWGSDDRWISPSDARRFEAEIHGSRLTMLDACGHVPQEECPAAFLAATVSFWN
jgi:pimeloyl-ACP methyl ester carboxylesterase